MKKGWIIGLLAVIASLCVLAACGDGGVAEFEVNEAKRFIEIGETFKVPHIVAKNEKGKDLDVSVSVVDPNGEAVELRNASFKAEILGDYAVEYSIPSLTKGFTVECFDGTVPEIETTLYYHNITVVGESFDTKTITMSDNSGESIAPEITVYFDDAEVETDDGVVVFAEKGSYVIHVRGRDSSDNVAEQDYVVYTEMNFEDGNYYENQWYVSQISDLHAFEGEKSYEFGMFNEHYEWFDDLSMLGEVKILGEYTTLSFWVLFDTETAGFNGSVLTNRIDYEMAVYNIYGEEQALNGDGKYEFADGKWYRWVIELDEPLTESSGVVTILEQFKIYLGVWDLDAKANASKPSKMYMDHIRLIDPAIGDDETYVTLPVTAYEKGVKLETIGYKEMFDAVIDAEGEFVTDSDYIDYTFMHGAVSGPTAFTADTVGAADEDNGQYAFAESWRIHTGHNDAFIYALTAKQLIMIEFALQSTDDGDNGNTGGWVDTNDSLFAVYIKSVSGELTLMYEKANSSAVDMIPAAMALAEGETLYYVYNFEWSDSRNIENPPKVVLYEAVAVTE